MAAVNADTIRKNTRSQHVLGKYDFVLSEKMKHSNITVSSGKLQFAELIKAYFYTPFGTVRASCLSPWERWPSAGVPEGEVPENTSCLSLWRGWPSAGSARRGEVPGIHLASLGRWPSVGCPKREVPGNTSCLSFGRDGRAQRVPEGEKYPGIHLASPLGRGGRAQRVPEGEKYLNTSCLSPWERWLSAASARRGEVPGNTSWLLPLGEVAERSEDGEGNQ